MTGTSKPLVQPIPWSAPVASNFRAFASVVPSVNMKILVLAGDTGEFSYQSITTYLNQIGVPYTGIGVNTLTPDSSGNRLSRLPLTDSAGRGLYQGLIYTNSSFGYCNPTCTNLLTDADYSTLSGYATQFKVRVVTYYTFPEPKWGMSIVGNGASYPASSPLRVSLTAAGASIFSYINSANPIPVAGSGAGAIYAYQATPVAAAGETTTPILTVGSNVVGVTHTNAAGLESLSLTMDNFPSLLHSLAFSYGVINWVTNGVFLGQRQIYINPQVDDILLGNRLYAPTLPQCPQDPSCPDVQGTVTDVQAFVNWQNAKHQDPLLPNLRISWGYVGVGSTPAVAPVPDTLTPAMRTFAADFGYVSHTWTHPNFDCISLTGASVCVPATFDQALFELERNVVFAQNLPIPYDPTGLITPFNAGVTNPNLLQAAAAEGITSIISGYDPPSPGTGLISIVPSILLIPRRVTNLFVEVDSPLTGVFGSLVDDYNSFYGPNGKTPAFATNQTYSQIIDNESTTLLQLRLLTYEPYPLGFHIANTIAYDGVHSLLTDLFDATIAKYKQLYKLPILTLSNMRDIAPLLLNRASYNASGVTGVYTPGVSVVLTTANAGVIPVTGACSQAVCANYGGQIQDRVALAAGASVTLSLTASAGVGLSNVTVDPVSVASRTPSQGVVSLNGVATSNVTVALSSSNPAVASVPSSVTVKTGDSGAWFAISTNGSVASATTVNISAAYNSVTRVAPLTITPAVALSGISLSSSSVAAGASPIGTISLTGPAPAGGISVSVLSNDLAAVVPTRVAVAAGSSSATFNITTLPVGSSAAGSIVAVYNGVNVSAPFTVTPGSPLAISTVSLNPAAVIGGAVSTGTVTLNGLAPAGGAAIALTSGNPAVVVPATIFVNAGAATATFTANTSSVAASTPVTIGASYKGASATAILTVAPTFGLAAVSLNPTSVVGGASSTGTVTLNSAAPVGGTVVTLTDDSAAVTVPASVTVAAGASSATFAATTTAVTATVNATISAIYGGVTRTSVLTLTPSVALSSVSLNPASVTAGSPSTGTVTLTGAAPSGGILVRLTGSDPAVTVPASVTVAAGATSATFAVTTSTVTAAVNATISANYGGVIKTSVLAIAPDAALASVSVAPSSVTAGAPATGTVTLTAPAPAGGISVTLSDTEASVVVPPSVTVAAGATSATFAVTTSAIPSAISDTITAGYNGRTRTAVLAVAPGVALSTISLNPASVTGGLSSTGTVNLTGAAPAGGVVVSLTDSDPAVTVPNSVTVAAGATSATFPVTTAVVATTTNATISATYAGITKTAALALTPAVALSSLSLNPTTVTGGSPATGTVTLSGSAPAGGIVVMLAVNNSAVTLPASVTVAAGATSATFTIATVAVNPSANATVSATYNGVTKTALLTVMPTVTLFSLSLSPSTVTGGTSSTGTVTLTAAAPSGGIVVTLSDGSAAVSVPASVTVAAGSSSATFTITTSAVAGLNNDNINASYNGVTKTAVLTLTPSVALSAVSINPATVTGGSSATGTVSLGSAAPAGGIVVMLTDNSAAVNVPVSVTVPAGSSSANFAVTTSTVTATASVTVSAAFNGVTRTVGFNVTPSISLSGFSLNRTSVTGGTSATATVTLSAAAPSGGATVTLTDTSTAAAVPTSVTVAAGNTSATFTVSTSSVAGTVTDTISAAYGGVTRTATLTVAPAALSTLTLNPAYVEAWGSSTGTVTLTGPAPAGGAFIALATDNFYTAGVPLGITIPAGSSTGSFNIRTLPFFYQTEATLSATYNGTTKSAVISVEGFWD